MLKIIVAVLACLYSIGSISIEDYYKERSLFEIGRFYFVSEEDLAITNHFENRLKECFLYDITFESITRSCHSNSKLCFEDLSVPSSASNSTRQSLSHRLNDCSRQGNNEEREYILQEAIAQYPWNDNAIKNLAFHYEWNGQIGATIELYHHCSRLTGDLGCKIHSALANPPILWNEHQSRYFYLRTISKLFSLLLLPSVHHSLPLLALRELPLNIQYNGHNINLVHKLLGMVFMKHFSVLSIESSLVSSAVTHVVDQRRVIRLGIVAGKTRNLTSYCLIHLLESHSNSSPGLCIHKILQSLVQLNAADPSVEFQLVFFDRPGLHTIFAETMRNIAVETIVLEETIDVLQTAQLISNAKVDILLYLALPSEKLTVFLAHLR